MVMVMHHQVIANIPFLFYRSLCLCEMTDIGVCLRWIPACLRCKKDPDMSDWYSQDKQKEASRSIYIIHSGSEGCQNFTCQRDQVM